MEYKEAFRMFSLTCIYEYQFSLSLLLSFFLFLFLTAEANKDDGVKRFRYSAIWHNIVRINSFSIPSLIRLQHFTQTHTQIWRINLKTVKLPLGYILHFIAKVFVIRSPCGVAIIIWLTPNAWKFRLQAYAIQIGF